MCHAMDEEDWVDVVMPPACLQDEDTPPTKLKGEPFSDSDDGDRGQLPKDVCDGTGDIDQLEETHDPRIVATDAVLNDDEGGPDCTEERELILCPNRCGVQIPAEDIEEHLGQSCRRAIVACEFAGCDVKLPRAEMQYHYRNEMPMHLLMLSKSVATILNKVEILENKSSATSSRSGARKESQYRSASGASGGSKHTSSVQADNDDTTAQAQSPSGGFMSRFPFSLRGMFTKKTSVICSTCHDEFRCNSTENIGAINCERY